MRNQERALFRPDQSVTTLGEEQQSLTLKDCFIYFQSLNALGALTAASNYQEGLLSTEKVLPGKDAWVKISLDDTAVVYAYFWDEQALV